MFMNNFTKKDIGFLDKDGHHYIHYILFNNTWISFKRSIKFVFDIQIRRYGMMWYDCQ